MKRTAVFLAVLTLFLFFPCASNAGKGKGNQGPGNLYLDTAVTGCTWSLVGSNMEAYKKRGIKDGKPATEEELELVSGFMTEMLRPFCRCMIEELIREQGLVEFSFNALMKKDPDAAKRIIQSGKCKYPAPDANKGNELRQKIQALESKQKNRGQDKP